MVEIERKFLVKTDLWKPSGSGSIIRQGYLSFDPERVIRVRITGESSFITIKGKPNGIVRTELEYEIPFVEAEVLLKMCHDFPVEKTRYISRVGNMNWEIDVFGGKNAGLVMAEIELTHENQEFELPDWVGEEVSHDKRYFNSWLSANPFSNW